MKRKGICIALCACLLLAGCGDKIAVTEAEGYTEDQYELATTTPFGKYPDTVTYTLGKMTGLNNSNMPSGDTYEDNAYTRYLLQQLNIQNEDAFEEDEIYDETVSMAIASNKIPDIMIVNDKETLQLLVEKDMIEDLSMAYEQCASDRIKDIYSSYGSDILDEVTFDGKMMALPETNIDNGPSLIWLRKDWMDKLGLEEPKTIDDVDNIVSAFVEQDPGKNGEGQTIGLACDEALTGECGYSYEYQTDIIFANYGAYPKQWIQQEDGTIVYGSVQPEAKEALSRLHMMYEEGILDNQFLVRGRSNIINLIVNGQCGAFYGPWWAPNNPLMDAMNKNPDAEWQPYLIHTDEAGNTSFASQNPSYKYVVVRKGYEHPELVMKMVSVLFDDMTYGEEGKEEIQLYYQENVDPTARPLAINVDYKDALFRCYENLSIALQSDSDMSTLPLLEGAYYASCQNYVNFPEKANTEDWAAYTSRMTACQTLEEGQVNEVQSMFFGETPSMQTQWWKLEELEKTVYLQIVTGEKPISYFDEFVEQWNELGGDTITDEVNQKILKNH